MHGRETPKPLRYSLLCGWPELSIGKQWELLTEHARSAGWIDVGWGFFVSLCRHVHGVMLTGVLR